MTQPPGYYGQPGGGYGDPHSQPSSPAGGYADPYAQPSGPAASGYGGNMYGQVYGQPSAPPGGYGDPYQQYGTGMPTPGFPPPPVPRKRRTGLIIGIATGVLALLLLGGGAIFYLTGVGSTTATVEGFLEAVFVDRDINAVKEYVCAKEVDEVKRDFTSGEAPRFTASWSNVRETSNDGTNAKVSADMSVKTQVKGQTTQVSGTWVFILVNESGWKVCDMQTNNR